MLSDLYDTRRSVASGEVTVAGRRGMVSSPHPLASSAGVAALQRGGTAVDAAVAVSATLGVVEPYMSGPGGIGSMLVHWAATSEQLALDFNSCLPAGFPPDAWDEARLMTGFGAALVPAAVAGWLAAHARFGRLPLAAVLEDAIAHAAGGVPLTPKGIHFVSRSRERLAGDATATATFFEAGEPRRVVVQPDLAETYRSLSAESFYHGSVAGRIVDAEASGGGYLTRSDLASYQPTWTSPASTSFRGWKVVSMPPPSGGLQILDTLSLLDGFEPLTRPGEHEHVLLECIKAAVACRRERLRRAGDPTRVQPSSDEQLAAARGAIRFDTAAPSEGDRLAAAVVARPPADGRLFTTAFVVADGDGNLVCSTQTLGQLFGGARVYGSTGMFCNNAAWWTEPTGPLAPRPGAPIESPLAPLIAVHSNGAIVGIASPGSNGILQTLPQMLVNLVDRGMPPASAIAAPRLVSFGRRPFMDPWGDERPPTLVGAENRLGEATLSTLRARGHVIELVGDWSHTMGAGAMVVREPSGTLIGAADPRRDGQAIAW